MRASTSIGLAVAALLAAAPALADAAATGHWASIAAEVCAATGRTATLAAAGHTEEAKATIVDAYFTTFEGSRMEIAERSILGAAHTADIEDLFNTLRKAAAKPVGADVPGLAARLCAAVRADGAALDTAGIGANGGGQ